MAVIGVPHERWGKSVHAVIVLGAGATLTDGEVDAACRGQLASYKTPRRYEFVDQIPKTGTGKVMRRATRRGMAGPRRKCRRLMPTRIERPPSSDNDHERLRRAIASANIPTLLLVVHQLSGDRRWLDERYRPTAMRGTDDNDSGGLPEEVQERDPRTLRSR